MTTDTHYSVASAKAREELKKEVRYMTVEEAKTLHYGQHVLVLDSKGKWANAKVNGQPKTWKRDTAHVVVPLKYGMYEYFSEEFTASNPTTALVVEL